MLLKCINEGFPNLKVDYRYDIAEIAEMLGHAMARKPNGEWPKPCEKYFGFHPEAYFESPEDGLEIVSCGYDLIDDDFFGVIIPSSEYKNVKQFESTLTAVVEKYDEKYPVWYLYWRNILASASHPKLERNFFVIGFEHSDLGRSLTYEEGRHLIRKILRELNLSHLSKNIGDIYYEIWRKHRSDVRTAQGLTW